MIALIDIGLAHVDSTTLKALADFPARLEAHFAAFPREHRAWRPASWHGVPSEPFTAIEQLCHIHDIEVDGYHVRLHRTLEESNPLLESIDGEALAVQRAYRDADSGRVLLQFREARRKTIALLADLKPEQLARVAVFEGQSVTLGGLAHNLCSHDHQHLAGLQWLLGRLAAAARCE